MLMLTLFDDDLVRIMIKTEIGSWCLATWSQPHERTVKCCSASLAEHVNGCSEYTNHKHTNKSKNVVRVQRFAICTLFAITRVVVNKSS